MTVTLMTKLAKINKYHGSLGHYRNSTLVVRLLSWWTYNKLAQKHLVH